MAGLYIHIPFCASRCIYCSFYSTTHLNLRQQYVDAICREMEMRSLASSGRTTGDTVLGGYTSAPLSITTVYIGGGTPSQLTTAQLEQLFSKINKVYGNQAEEITIEANPDDVTPEFATTLSRLGINRVSMGAQTFDDARLRWLHRRHTAAQVPQAVALLRSAGINNISIDLMYGFPNETLDDWQHDIDAILSLDVEHISAYCLMIEEGTMLYEQMRNEKAAIKQGQNKVCLSHAECEQARHDVSNEEMRNEETERTMYEMLIDRLAAAGYEHYEISNWARQNFRSRHNSNYWHDIPYIGLGAAAHSYTIASGFADEPQAVRSWNVSDLNQYFDAINQGQLPSEFEIIDADTHYNDRITTALRTCDGLDLNTLLERHRCYCIKEAQPFLNSGMLRLIDNCLILTRQGLFVSDMVMSSLMIV